MVEASSLLSLGSSPCCAFLSPVASVRDESSMRHKVAKLSEDADSASSSRNRNAPGASRSAAGPARVQVMGLDHPDFSSAKEKAKKNQLLKDAKTSIRLLIDGEFTNSSPLSRERLYAVTRYIVTVTPDDADGLLDELRDRLGKAVKRMYSEFLGEKGEDFFKDVARDLDIFERRVDEARGALSFLDRLYITEKMYPESIQRIAHTTLSKGVFDQKEFVKRLVFAISEWLRIERENEAAHDAREYIPRVIRHLQQHQLYSALFEKAYFDCTREFYSTKRDVVKDPHDFLTYGLRKVLEEADRAANVLPESSHAAVRKTVELTLMNGKAEWLANGVTGKLLDDKNFEELARLHDLLRRTELDGTLVDAFRTAVRERVATITKDVARSDEMVERLLTLKAACDAALTRGFANGRREFAYALADGFTKGFLARRRAPAEMLAKHVDRLMRKGHQGASDEEFGGKLDAVLALYRYTDDKDVFRTFYHRALSRRLLLGRSASDDFEKAVLKKLKEQYDPEFGMGDQMFNDLMLSRDMMREYHDRQREGSAAHALTAMILQASVWPFSARTESSLLLPHAMQQELEAFQQFYQEKHKGRKLEWNHALGTATLTARFPRAKKTQDHTKNLTVSLYQAAVLLLFEDADPEVPVEIGYREISANLQISDAELRRTLQSLACGKKRVLKKFPAGAEVNGDDKFTVNEAFRDPFHTVHINSIQAKETPEESKRTQQAIEGDRKHLLDAAIVRIMKAKKQLTYEEIKTQTIDAVRRHFAPDVASIKQRIDALVEGEYLRRDEDDRTLFYYVA